MFLPEEDRYSHSRRFIISQICSLFGGRIAEEIINGKDGITTGASNDIEVATGIAKNMVTKWGLSEKMGPMSYSDEDGEVFLGKSVTQHKAMSDDTVSELLIMRSDYMVNKNYKRSEQILKKNIDKLPVCLSC